MQGEMIQTAEATAQVPAQSHAISAFSDAMRIGNVFAKSQLVPQQYYGKPGDCAIAVDMASRMGVSPLMVMQQLYVVKGKPSWSGQACLSFIRQRYKDVKVVYTGDRGTDTRGCYISAMDGDSKIDGVEVTIQMAKSEGWLSNKKWQSMPDLMLAYRAGAFFARVHCPDVLMGCLVEGEEEDIETVPQKRTVEDVL